jgi:DNA-binding transcriptional LysR family regulator
MGLEPGPALDLRKLRYFVAVAEHLHFGRAAAALHIAQPVLSRQIRALEHELKSQLFDRTKRATALTRAGEQLLVDARPLLAGADALQRRVQRAARGPGHFTVGFMPGLIVTPATRVLATRHPDLTVDVLRTSWDDQTEVVLDPLLAEPRVAALPLDHPLAAKDGISISDLAHEHLLQHPDAVPEWRDIAVELRSGRGEPPRPIRTVEEKLEHVAAGHGLVVLPLSTATFYTRPDITWVPIDDIGPNRVCLAWDNARTEPLIHEFVEIATAQAEQLSSPA